MILPKLFGVHLALFADDACLYGSERKACYVLRKLWCGLNSIAAWCIALNGRDIPFVNSVKYLGVIFDKKIAW
jgi:hypothetical protein